MAQYGRRASRTILIDEFCFQSAHRQTSCSLSSELHIKFHHVRFQGFEAAKALNVTQGDISLCCRGMRQQVEGYKLRFVAEKARPEAKLKRCFAYEPVLDEASKDLSLAGRVEENLERQVARHLPR